jgi:selenide,water dikinase
MGHLFELASASDVQVEVYSEAVPIMSGAMEYASLGLIPAGAYANRDYLEGKLFYQDQIDPDLRELLFCPETAGGLLMAVPAGQEEEFLRNMASRKVTVSLIGRVTAEKFAPMRIRRNRGFDGDKK